VRTRHKGLETADSLVESFGRRGAESLFPRRPSRDAGAKERSHVL
jgi:hypothetical protein